MPYVTLSGGLTLTIPTAGTNNYADTIRSGAWQKIADHDHTGGGRGTQIGAGAIASNAITDSSIRLSNNSYLRARNAANSGDVSLLKANASDEAEFGARLAGFTVKNNTYISGRNAANSADVSIIKLNASDRIEFGTTVNSLTLNTALGIAYGGTGLTGTPSNGQLPVGNGTGFTLAAITGTSNQVNVTNGAGTITLSTPQSIGTGSSPTFAGLTISANTGFVSSAANAAWSPTITGSGSMTVTPTAQKNTEYLRLGGLVYFRLCVVVTIGGTPSTLVNFSAPVAGVADDVTAAWHGAGEQGSNAYGVSTREEVRWRYDGTNIVVFLTNSANWTAGSTTIHIQGMYKVTS